MVASSYFTQSKSGHFIGAAHKKYVLSTSSYLYMFICPFILDLNLSLTNALFTASTRDAKIIGAKVAEVDINDIRGPRH